MMKNLIKNTLILLALLLPSFASAHDFEVDGIYYNINGNEATVTSGKSNYIGEVTIPTTVTYNGVTYSVTSIGYEAFYNCTELTSIDIPSSVTSIGSYAFYGCTGLTSINIPNSVTEIGYEAFCYCTGLTSIVVASDNPYYDSRDNCNAIIETAYNSLKFGCKNTTIPNSVTFIGTSAFYECTGLTGIIIPNSLTAIGTSAFYGCTGLTCINIPNSVTSIGYEAFCYCTGLTSIDIPNSVTEIGERAFRGCGLTSIDIPNSVTEIRNRTFECCTRLTSVNIPNSVTFIGDWAFSNCTGLTSIDIPNSVTFIRDEVFLRCTGLTSINCFATTPPNISEDTFDVSHYTAVTLTVPRNCEISYLCARGWQNFSNINEIPYDFKKNDIYYIITSSNTVEVTCGGINNNSYSGTVNIPKTVSYDGTTYTVTSISNSAFLGCIGLTSIDIPNSVTSIGGYAFSGCTGLTSINIPNSVTSIGYSAFYGCTGLTSIYCFATTPPECDDDNVFSQYSATLHVPAASLAAYFTAPVWCNFENIVGDAVAPTGISISADSMEIHLGEQFELTATVTPANASIKEVTWFSTDTTVAIVENGSVTSVGYGECDIVAMCFGMQAVCHVSVANRIMLDQHEVMLQPNHLLTLTPSVHVMPQGFTVTSSDPTVAAARVMNGKVQVVGVAEGTATITVGAADGTAIPATCLVTVYTETGDVNMDGFTDIDDVTAMVSYVLGDGVDVFKAGNANLNGDNAIDIDDITALISQILGN